ncbi:formimidoylglutamate deiminase [Kangiella sp.]|uniref:formimidoylglutamate deiminase n=1 Tax=Kangiella sp. TaxID=1920245 RepID=UPI003A95DAF0
MPEKNDKQLFAKHLLTESGWAKDVLIKLDCNGVILELKPDTQLDSDFCGEQLHGSVIPGLPNSHSHAFQWAMAGLGEKSGKGGDSFWTWRQAMYGFVDAIRPEDLQAIASALYMQMLKAGYTSVGEFHYLHHNTNGAAFDNPAEMSQRIFESAKESGIGLTLLPVFYRYSGFGELAPNDGQKRFIHDQQAYATLIYNVAKLSEQYQQSFGIAPHSLRAVNQQDLSFAIDHLNTLNDKAPVHIHIAEQMKEVDDCLVFHSKRPVEWLLDNLDVNERWCLVHATHMTQQETHRVAQSNAVVAVCTTTEANLGDGFFPMLEYKKNQGRWSVGSDSHISVDAAEELRWLEYQQRLAEQSRTVMVEEEHSSNGYWLWQQAAGAGAQSLGRNAGCIKVGNKADFIELNPESFALLGKSDHQLIDAFIFNHQFSNDAIRSVWVNGECQVSDGVHRNEEKIRHQYQKTIHRLSQCIA